MTLFITDSECKQLMSIETAIPVVDEAFRLAGEGLAENPPRTRMPIAFKEPRYEGYLQLGPSAIAPAKVAGFKLFSNFGKPVHGRQYGRTWNFLFSLETGELLAIIQAHAIGIIRTSAVSGAAVKHLSRPDASVAALYGAGTYAEGQLAAVCAVRPIKKAYVYSRTPEKREAFCRAASARLGIEMIPSAQAEQPAREAEIIVTMTNSFEPVLFGGWIARPGLVVAAGANHWYRREIDSKLVEMATLLAVDGVDVAKVESGAILRAVAEGRRSWGQVEEFGRVVAGRVAIPDFSAGTILFASHGLSLIDVAVSARVYELARAKGMGREIDLEGEWRARDHS